MTLRSKLLMSPAPIAVALLLLGVASVRTLRALGESPEVILKDNFRSVRALERMLEALSGIQERAFAEVAGSPSAADSGLRARFEEDLRAQEQNITERGEREATARLRAAWERYQASLDALARVPPRERMAAFGADLQPRAAEVRRAADEVLALNQEAMARKSDRARRAASRNEDLVVVATIAALALGVVTSLVLTARLLRPLGVLSQTVRRLGEGDLEARARVDGKDEIADLAAEFNAMADRLSEYRRSSLGELLQAQQASQAAIDSLPDPVLVLDSKGEILNLNRAAEQVLLLGNAASLDTLHPELRAMVERVRHHVLGGHGAYLPRGFDEAVQISAPGGARRLLPRAAPLYSEEAGVVGVTIVLQDVTRLMRFDELKNDLVATVAHEFRTPLTSLRMAIHLLAEEVVGPLGEKQAELVGAARDECERLQGIIDDLLDLSRIQAGRMELREQPVGVAGLLTAAADEQRGAAGAARVTLQVEKPPWSPEDALIHADRERVLLVLSNLIANALRHTPQGGSITLRARQAGDRARFEVQDTGEGIAPEHQERIFEKFYRVPGERGGGVGLGLYIAREIVLAHGGEMGVVSAPGAGSTFWFTLKGARPARAATGD